MADTYHTSVSLCTGYRVV